VFANVFTIEISFCHLSSISEAAFYCNVSNFFYNLLFSPPVAMMAALVNSMVHVIMYFYYALAAMGLHRFLWWKKHITHLQLIQFFGAGTQALWSLYIDCPFPKWMHLTLIAYACSLIVLFLNFYIHAYCKRKHSGKGSSATSNGTPVSNGTADKAPLNGKKKTE
jgi:elongation of very long chain fatty acids protein 4